MLSMHRHSRFEDAPIPVASWDDLEQRRPSTSDSNHNALDGADLVSPLGTTFNFPDAHDYYQPPPPPPPPRSATDCTIASYSPVSQLSITPPATEDFPARHWRSPSPTSDKEATSLPLYCPSYRSPTSRRAVRQPEYSEKQVAVSSSYSDSYPTSRPPNYPYSPNDYSHHFSREQDRERQYQHQHSRVNEQEPTAMRFFRRSQQVPPPSSASEGTLYRQASDPPWPRSGSVPTLDEKQTTGIAYFTADNPSADEKQPLYTPQSPLAAQIGAARSARVKAVVDAYIEPLLRSQASEGLTESTLVLVPSTSPPSLLEDDTAGATSWSSEAKSYPKAWDDKVTSAGGQAENPALVDHGTVIPPSQARHMLVGFPTEHAVRVVRLAAGARFSGHTGASGSARDLHGDEGARFWHQPAALRDLDRLLRIRLADMGLDVLDPAAAVGAAILPSSAAIGGGPSVAATTKKAWAGNGWEAGLGIWTESGRDRAQSSWQLEDRPSALLPGQASVAVQLKEVCFRTENEMGLYDTKAEQAVVVKVVIEG